MNAKRRTAASSRVFVICVLIFLLSFAVVWGVYTFIPEDATPGTIRNAITLELAKIFTQLAVIGVVGTLIKFLLDEHAVRRRRDEAEEAEQQRQQNARRDFRQGLWRGLRDVYSQVENARNLIEGAKSARTYGQQVREIMDLRTQLGEIRHEVAFSADTFEAKEALSSWIRRMEKYLEGLIEEYGKEYKSLSDSQSAYEKEKDSGRTTIDMDVELDRLSKLRDFRHAGETGEFHREFRLSYFRARQAILKELEKTLQFKGQPIAPEAELRIRDEFGKFEKHLRGLGARFGDSMTINVLDDAEMAAEMSVYRSERGFEPSTLAFYDPAGEELKVAHGSVDHLDVALREFCFYAFHGTLEDQELLAAVSRVDVDGPAGETGALISGLGYYLPSSFKDNPSLHTMAILDLRAVEPSIWDSELQTAAPPIRAWMTIDAVARRWAGAFWELRQAEAAKSFDKRLIRAWNETPKTMREPSIAAIFAQKLAAGGGAVQEVLKARGLTA